MPETSNEQTQTVEVPASGEFTLLHPAEGLNRPSWKRFELQGSDRILVLVYPNTEYRQGGVVIPNLEDVQNIPTCGKVLQVSPRFNHRKYPGIKVGANVKVELATFRCFPCNGDVLAICDAECVIATYAWDGPDTIKREIEEMKQAIAEKSAERERKLQETTIDPSLGPKSPIVIFKEPLISLDGRRL